MERRRRWKGRGNVNGEGKMTREKKVMTRGRRSKERVWWGKVILIVIFKLRRA
jgi:hypothetical protein